MVKKWMICENPIVSISTPCFFFEGQKPMIFFGFLGCQNWKKYIYKKNHQLLH